MKKSWENESTISRVRIIAVPYALCAGLIASKRSVNDWIVGSDVSS
ncbi:hypothetical protein FOPG_19837 [Fusarium oxysporum f. sp. conglutinans race 2 54008]|uniref:Uncharacterized protein n=1 Tax=Fusarium oxysporum f. sp. conglutinans race 2 54008 TaxID=1089457 RepID=X0GVQ5_FUSOX|nr:hypothetical protein FOPG_19837 [Fusarium oxysporum f. sp. conglutinans race 2 54008]